MQSWPKIIKKTSATAFLNEQNGLGMVSECISYQAILFLSAVITFFELPENDSFKFGACMQKWSGVIALPQ